MHSRLHHGVSSMYLNCRFGTKTSSGIEKTRQKLSCYLLHPSQTSKKCDQPGTSCRQIAAHAGNAAPIPPAPCQHTISSAHEKIQYFTSNGSSLPHTTLSYHVLKKGTPLPPFYVLFCHIHLPKHLNLVKVRLQQKHNAYGERYTEFLNSSVRAHSS